MNKIRYILISLFFIVTGCVSLDEEPMMFITPDQFYKTVEEANASCLGLYSNMYIDSELWTQTTRSVTGNNDDGRMQDANILEPSVIASSHMSTLWQSYYILVRKCNTTMEGLEKSPLRADQKNPYIGEAIAMRAFAYLRLVKNWGDVPVRTQTEVKGSYYELTPLKAVYELILNDLNEALYVYRIWGPNSKPGRIDEAGVRIMIADAAITIAQSAKSYQTGSPDAIALKPYADAFGNDVNRYFEIARSHMDTLINMQAKYGLFDGNWIDMFGRTADGKDNVNNKEVILRTQTIPDLYRSGLKTVPANSDLLPADLGGIPICPTYEYVASFHKDDIRRNTGFVWHYQYLRTLSNVTEIHLPYRQFGNEPYEEVGYDFAAPTPGYADYPNIDLGEQWNDRKQEYWSGDNLTVIFFDPNYRTPACKKYYDQSCISGAVAVSVPLYRMAEAHLIYAEAEAALNGVTQEAVDYLNAIHTRAFENATDHTFKISDFNDIADFNRALVDEYLWELGFENKEFFVLIRFGQLQQRIQKVTDLYNPKCSPGGYSGPVLGVQAAIGDLDKVQYALRQRKVRGVDQYWMPYPHAGEKELNDAIAGLDRMKYQ